MELGPREVLAIVGVASGAIVLAQKAMSVAEKAIGRKQNSNGGIQRALDEARYETKVEGLLGRLVNGQGVQNDRLLKIEENTSRLLEKQ
jgi:type II secretory pathway pseudopilin PulG